MSPDPAGDSACSAAVQGRSLDAPPQIDGYELLELLGRGGMGVVYEAYQRSTGRRVAVKFLLDSLARGEDARRRFEREVELVSRLSHPGIVAIVDSGVQRANYFYVMEYVEGAPLDQALPPGQSDARRVCETLIAICEAVDYAHQRGVLHRDLKPSNILIDAAGRPRLLDFGLGKAMEPETGRWLDMTLSAPGQLVGTLGYMSPEQARGDLAQTSVRSDVYALGAILYELLTGVLPCAVEGPLLETLARISRDDPIPPSRRAGSSVVKTPRWRSSRDLDAVVMRALAKEPAARYSGAAELAADLRAALDDRPVRARPVSGLGRAWRSVRRHRGLASVSGAALLALSVLGVYSAVQITSERDRAREKLKSALQVMDRLIFDTDRTLAETLGTEQVRRAMLDLAVDFYERLPRDAALLALEDLTGPQYGRLGEVLRERDDVPRATRFFQLHLDAARRAAQRRPHELERRLALAGALRSGVHDALPDQQRARLDEARSILRALRTARPEDNDVLHEAAAVELDSAAIAARSAAPLDAIAPATTAVEFARALAAHAPGTDQSSIDAASVAHRAAAIALAAGAAPQTREWALWAAAQLRDPPDWPLIEASLQAARLQLLGRCAGLLVETGDFNNVRAILDDARAISDAAIAGWPQDLRMRLAGADILAYLANSAFRQECCDEAIELYAKSSGVVLPAFELQPGSIEYRRRYAMNLAGMGNCHFIGGDLPAAGAVYRRFLDVSGPLFEEDVEYAWVRGFAWMVLASASLPDASAAREAAIHGLADLERLSRRRPLAAQEEQLRGQLAQWINVGAAPSATPSP